MKRFIYLTVFLMTVFVFIGCSGMATQQRSTGYDLGGSVGNRPFVGDTSLEAKKAALGIGMP